MSRTTTSPAGKLTGVVEVVDGQYAGCRGVIFDGAGRGGVHGYESVKITDDPEGRLSPGVIERFDPKMLKEVDLAEWPSAAVLP